MFHVVVSSAVLHFRSLFASLFGMKLIFYQLLQRLLLRRCAHACQSWS